MIQTSFKSIKKGELDNLTLCFSKRKNVQIEGRDSGGMIY